MIQEWKKCLLDHADEWGIPKSGDWNFLFYNNYHPHCSDLDILWFRNRERAPRVVVKISRERSRPEREFLNLQEVHAAAPKWVPRPLHFATDGNLWALWMKGVPGMRFQGKRTPAVLQSMVEMVSALHAAVRRPAGSPHPERYRQAIVDPLTALAEFGSVEAVRIGCQRLMARVTSTWVNTLPVIPQHGDLYTGNLLTDAGEWYLVDWESFGTVDLPTYDLYTLLLSLLRTGGDECAQWRGDTRQMPSLVRSYQDRLALGHADMALLLPLTLANWFYIQWRDGREEFSKRMYATITDYFEHYQQWEEVFFHKASA